MAGDPIYNCCDATCITNTTSTCSSSYDTFRVGFNSSSDYYYAREYQQSKSVPKPTKEQMQKERADKLHKLSFVLKHEISPNVFKMIGYPFKNAPKPYYRNYK